MAKKKPTRSKQRIQEMAANPGLRSLLADKYLTKGQLQQRQLNQRLNAPVTEGSSLTNRELAHQANDYTTVKYGPQEQAYNSSLAANAQLGKDMGSWYDQYQAALAQHRQNVSDNVTAGDTSLKNLVGGIGGAAGAVQGSATEGESANAAAVRQAMIGSFAAAQGQIGRNAVDYADTLANVVAPGQKLTSLAGNARDAQAIRDKQTGLAAQKGADNSSFRAQTIQGEQKNVLAQQALSGKTAAEQAREKIAAGRLDIARGIDPVTGKPLPKKPTSGPDMGKVNAYGYTEADWRKMSTAQRQEIIAAAKAKGGSKGAGGKGPEWLTPNEMNTGITQLAKLKDFANKAKTGQPFVPGHTPQGPMTRQQAAQKIFGAAPSLKDPSLLAAALDAAYDGHLSPSTVQRLIDAGYKPSRVAQTLGVKTAGQMPKAPKVQIHTRSPSSGPSGGDPTGRFRS